MTQQLQLATKINEALLQLALLRREAIGVGGIRVPHGPICPRGPHGIELPLGRFELTVHALDLQIKLGVAHLHQGFTLLHFRAVRDEHFINQSAARREHVAPHDRLEIATTDFLASGALFPPITLSSGYVVPVAAPIVREAVETWLRRRGGNLRQDQFVDPSHPRLNYPSPLPSQCASH